MAQKYIQGIPVQEVKTTKGDYSNDAVVNTEPKKLATNKPDIADIKNLVGGSNESYLNGAIEINDEGYLQFNDPSIFDENVEIFERIQDADGHNRFVEGEGTLTTIAGVSISYNRWCLSGTHLILVIAGTIASGTTIADSSTLVEYEVPEWVLDKISATQGQLIEYKDLITINSSYIKKTYSTYLSKRTDNISITLQATSGSQSGDGPFRLQYDLIIDNA